MNRDTITIKLDSELGKALVKRVEEHLEHKFKSILQYCETQEKHCKDIAEDRPEGVIRQYWNGSAQAYNDLARRIREGGK